MLLRPGGPDVALAAPYVGLNPFARRDERFFFGREKMSLSIATTVLSSRVTVLHGPSGSGKSSLIGAGLGKAVEALAPGTLILTYRRFQPGFEKRLFAAARARLGFPRAEPPLVEAMAHWTKNSRAHRAAGGQTPEEDDDDERETPIVLVLDQFEEFFRYHGDPSGHPLIQEIARIAGRRDLDAHILLSMRDDSIALLESLRFRMPDVLGNTVELPRLTIVEARDAITKPLTVFLGEGPRGVPEPALIEEILHQVRAGTSAGALPPPDTEAHPVEAPMLQLTLQRLWEEDKAANSKAMRLETLQDRLHGVRGVAEALFAESLAKRTDADVALLGEIFPRMVTASGAKHAYTATELERAIASDRPEGSAGGSTWAQFRDSLFDRLSAAVRPAQADRGTIRALLDTLARTDNRIMRTQPNSAVPEDPYFEVFHDALASPVRAWIARTANERARKVQAIRTTVLGTLAVLLFALSALSGVAVWRMTGETRRANEASDLAFQALKQTERVLEMANAAEKTAIHQRDAAFRQESRALAFLANATNVTDKGTALRDGLLRSGDPMTAMLVALEALPAPGFGGTRPHSPAAHMALQAAWLRNRETTLIAHKAAVVSAAFSPDGRRVVTASSDNTARVWDLSGERPVAVVLEGHKNPVVSAAFSPDGRRVVTASSDNTARVWDLSGERPVAVVLEGHKNWVLSAAFSPDGRRVVTASYDNTARVWDLSGERPVAVVLEGHKNRVQSAAFSPDGNKVLTVVSSGISPTMLIWPFPADPATTIMAARRALTRCLTLAQRETFGLSVPAIADVDRDAIHPPVDGECPWGRPEPGAR